MKRFSLLAGLLGLMITLGVANDALAKVPTYRNSGMRVPGAHGDHSVPYLTTGKTAFFTGTVVPNTVYTPNVDDVKNPGANPVFNVIFYGAKQGFGNKFDGATPR